MEIDRNECRCGSGLTQEPYYDARMIFLCYACDECWPIKQSLIIESPDWLLNKPNKDKPYTFSNRN